MFAPRFILTYAREGIDKPWTFAKFTSEDMSMHCSRHTDDRLTWTPLMCAGAILTLDVTHLCYLQVLNTLLCQPTCLQVISTEDVDNFNLTQQITRKELTFGGIHRGCIQ